jgi:DNA-directed RNA polymerase specialized sigma24 family protein
MARPLLAPPDARTVHVILSLWPQIRSDLRDKDADTLEGGYETSFEPRGKSSRPSNPTQARAIRRATDSELQRLQRLERAIERALATLRGQPGNRAAVAMRAHYLAGQSWGEIAKCLDVSRQAVNKWDQRFRVHVWQQIGRR